MIGSSSWQAGGATGVGDMHAVLLDAIRLAVGRLFLTAEPTLARTYAQLYATKTSRGYRCQNCYHLFGVDLIADAQRAMRVIEVSTAPSRTATTLISDPTNNDDDDDDEDADDGDDDDDGDGDDDDDDDGDDR